jgi:branched-chain amino acid transport system permease protein
LGGITSINGAIVGGMLTGSGLVAVVSNYFFRDTDLNTYLPVIGGASLVFTAVLHPEGIAPFFQPLMQHFGRWLAKARGAEWAAVGKRLGPVMLVGAVLGALVWPLRVDTYSWFWMPLLGAFLALFVRSIGMQIYRGLRGRGGHTEPAPVPGSVRVAEHV